MERGVPGGVWAAEAGLLFGLLALAAVLAPLSCSGGLEVYLLAGLAAAVGGAAVPIAAARSARPPVRVGLAIAAPVLLVGAWVLGLVLTDFRLLCRLF